MRGTQMVRKQVAVDRAQLGDPLDPKAVELRCRGRTDAEERSDRETIEVGEHIASRDDRHTGALDDTSTGDLWLGVTRRELGDQLRLPHPHRAIEIELFTDP